MAKAEDFLNKFKSEGLGPFIEIPCSILKPLINRIIEDREIELINPVNEGIAIGIASGAYMSSGQIPVVMIQNSGHLNTFNALTSLLQLYEIPILYLITWRGEPGKKDAPEHLITGINLERHLKSFDLPYIILSENYEKEIEEAIRIIKETKKPVALILKKGLIEDYKIEIKTEEKFMSRFDALKIIKNIAKDVIFISTNGHISRDSFAVKDSNDFYMMGSMGHALPIGLGISMNTKKKVFVLDGDGACLMHLGAMASVGKQKPKNLVHIVIDNETYGSTGKQPTVSPFVNFVKIAEGCGYKNFEKIEDREELEKAVKNALEKDGPTFIHVKINKSEEKRPRVSDKYTCTEIKERFMKIFEHF